MGQDFLDIHIKYGTRLLGHTVIKTLIINVEFTLGTHWMLLITLIFSNIGLLHSLRLLLYLARYASIYEDSQIKLDKANLYYNSSNISSIFSTNKNKSINSYYIH